MMTEKELEWMRKIKHDATEALKREDYERASVYLCSLFVIVKQALLDSDKRWALRLSNPCKN